MAGIEGLNLIESETLLECTKYVLYSPSLGKFFDADACMLMNDSSFCVDFKNATKYKSKSRMIEMYDYCLMSPELKDVVVLSCVETLEIVGQLDTEISIKKRIEELEPDVNKVLEMSDIEVNSLSKSAYETFRIKRRELKRLKRIEKEISY